MIDLFNNLSKLDRGVVTVMIMFIIIFGIVVVTSITKIVIAAIERNKPQNTVNNYYGYDHDDQVYQDDDEEADFEHERRS